MSGMGFVPDIEDLKFVLFHQLAIQNDLAGFEKLADFDRDTLESVIDEAARFATEVLSPINGPGDRQGCKLDGDGNVTTPEGFQEAWNLLAEGGWIGVNAPAEVGGSGMPNSINVMCNEFFSGAAPAFSMYSGLTAGAARVIQHYGQEAWAIEYAEKMFTGVWGGTMCLTEAGAGSDVGANRCKAARTEEDGVYLLEGEKIFISGGDNDFTENILHLVLARTEDAPAGTKGLSLFMVPKFLINEDGSSGERNSAYVVGIEEKMGIHGSATCTLALGDRGVCKGWIIGQEGQGIAIMFNMMNEARIGVACQGEAVASAAYQYALAYTRDRTQGSDVTQFKNANAPRVAIVQHPDVRRMLMTQKVLVETMRSMLLTIGHQSDVMEHTSDKSLAKKLEGRIDLLVPIAKSICSDLGFDVAVTALQCFGGYGYIGEYPIEQCVRDAKIFSIYEGTNGIQAMDLLGRKMNIGNGALFMDWMQDAQALCAKGAEMGYADEAGQIGKAIQHLGATAMHLAGVAMGGNLPGAMLQATPYLRMFGTIQLGLEALTQAIAAKEAAAELGDTPHLASKALNLRFYVYNLLPAAISTGKAIQANDTSCMDESLFT